MHLTLEDFLNESWFYFFDVHKVTAYALYYALYNYGIKSKEYKELTINKSALLKIMDYELKTINGDKIKQQMTCTDFTDDIMIHSFKNKRISVREYKARLDYVCNGLEVFLDANIDWLSSINGIKKHFVENPNPIYGKVFTKDNIDNIITDNSVHIVQKYIDDNQNAYTHYLNIIVDLHNQGFLEPDKIDELTAEVMVRK